MFRVPLGDGAEIRPLEPWQAEAFASYIAEHREHLAPWLPWATSITDADGARAFLQRYADGQAADERRMYALWLDGKLVGGCIFRIFDTYTRTCELGVWLSPAGEGRGLMTRACRELIAWAMDERGMNRVEWRCTPRNARSRAVAQRLGMTLEGVLRESSPFNGELLDTEVWALLARERKP
ncbi:MAG TPA: GNAT family protein [Kribbellaceae bacterium]|nr:GNAT family protein [Kribbellaceae bacterium]